MERHAPFGSKLQCRNTFTVEPETPLKCWLKKPFNECTLFKPCFPGTNFQVILQRVNNVSTMLYWHRCVSQEALRSGGSAGCFNQHLHPLPSYVITSDRNKLSLRICQAFVYLLFTCRVTKSLLCSVLAPHLQTRRRHREWIIRGLFLPWGERSPSKRGDAAHQQPL